MNVSKFFLSTLLISISLMSNAQQDSVKLSDAYYMGVGLGAGKGTHKGVFVLANVQIQHFENYLSLKVSSFAIFSPMGSSPPPTVSDLGLFIGKSYTFGQSHNLQFGAGLALVMASGRTPCNDCIIAEGNRYSTIRESVIGLPIELKYLHYIDRTGAISLSLNVNLNKEQSYFGTAIGLTAGRLRPKFKKQKT